MPCQPEEDLRNWHGQREPHTPFLQSESGSAAKICLHLTAVKAVLDPPKEQGSTGYVQLFWRKMRLFSAII